MIYVDLKGNLGNQLFIYAFARKVQQKTGEEICLSTFNLSKYFPSYEMTLNQYILNDKCHFENNKLPFYLNSNSILHKIFGKVFKPEYKVRKYFEKIRFRFLLKFGVLYWMGEDYMNFDFNLLKKYKNIYVNGFWQSHKYFDDIRAILLSEIVPKEGIKDCNKKLMSTVLNSDSVCVSIRRGDYVYNSKITKRYYLCDMNYFTRAVEMLYSWNPKISIICFSDDILWVKENVKFKCPMYYESGKDNVSQKLLLMSSCKYFILSNSSFSWWAQYLSDGLEVIAPSRWYSNGDGKDLYQDKWELVPIGDDINE
ncbi:MAG: alpha-1,2-fucosyltransferase [Anaerocolumna sp.]